MKALHWRQLRTAPLLGVLLLLAGCGGGDRNPANGPHAQPQPARADSAPAPAVPAPAVPPATAAAPVALTPLKFRDHNVIFVSFDALQAAHTSMHGYPRDVTPTIDRMAKQGFQFRRNTSVASWTVPASMTWFTGVYPSEHRMVNKYAVYQPGMKRTSRLKELAPDLVTLASVLRDNGYATGGFTGNAGVSGGFGYEDGFDEYYYEKGKFGRMEISIPKAMHWLRANKDKKFFLFLHGYDIHGQCTPVGGFDYRFVDKKYDSRYTGSELEQELLREEGLERGSVKLRPQDVKFWRAVYDEKIQRVDEKFKYFLKDFDKLGLMDKTIFVLTSDHGTELYEHHRFDHGFTLYQELIHTPLVIRTPKSTGRVIEDRISSIDIMPTILDLLEIEQPDKLKRQLRGASLVPAMQGEAVAKDVFSETDYREYTYKRCIISASGWKFIYTLEDDSRELYHLPTDPGEASNLAGSKPEKAAELQKRLFAHFKTTGRGLTSQRWKTGLNPVYPSQAPD